MATDHQIAAAEAALRDLEPDEGNWPTGEQLEAIIDATSPRDGQRAHFEIGDHQLLQVNITDEGVILDAFDRGPCTLTPDTMATEDDCTTHDHDTVLVGSRGMTADEWYDAIRTDQPATKASYANLSWSIEDAREIRPTWSDEQLADFLGSIENRLRDRLTELGWEALGTLADQHEATPAA